MSKKEEVKPCNDDEENESKDIIIQRRSSVVLRGKMGLLMLSKLKSCGSFQVQKTHRNMELQTKALSKKGGKRSVMSGVDHLSKEPSEMETNTRDCSMSKDHKGSADLNLSPL